MEGERERGALGVNEEKQHDIVRAEQQKGEAGGGMVVQVVGLEGIEAMGEG